MHRVSLCEVAPLFGGKAQHFHQEGHQLAISRGFERVFLALGALAAADGAVQFESAHEDVHEVRSESHKM